VSEAASLAASDVAASPRPLARVFVRVFVLALVLRAAVFPFADNKQSDAPMRALIAGRLAAAPSAAADPRAFCQFGPLHLLLMSPFVAAFGDVARSSRYLSLVAGLLVFVPFLRLARRLVGDGPAELAGLALAASPLAIQASTTAASEALYLLLFVTMLERLTSALAETSDTAAAPLGRYVAAGALASLAAVTRYDAWVALPVTLVAAWLFGVSRASTPAVRARHRRGLAAFAVTAALAPAAWMLWCAARTDDAIFFIHYISSDHAQLAATALARYGRVLARLRQLGIWALAFVSAMTLPLALAAVRTQGPRPRLAPAMRVVLVAGFAPLALYLLQGLARLSFEPLPRFALVPGTLLLPLAAASIPAARLGVARLVAPVAGVLWAVAMFVAATARPGRMWGGAEANGALTRLDGEDRALASYLRTHRAPGERVMIEPFGFAEIAVTEAANVPLTESVSLVVTREPAATVAETTRATGARWFAAYEDARPDRWTKRLPDWPRESLEVGRWRLIHR
jgi:4-amino-4-deoxy-L-arabinose transferase-like glycosyltransferase